MAVRGWVLTGCAVVALVAGCSNVTTGTPMADPGQTGISTTATATPSPSPTTRARVPDPTTSAAPGAPAAPPTGLAATTCTDYVNMDEATQREVIKAIGEQNELVRLNPELWITMASAMCTFAQPGTLVSDAVMGGGFGR
jgi:hypothetical protein